MIQAGEVPDLAKPQLLAKANNYQIGEQIVVIVAPSGVSHTLSKSGSSNGLGFVISVDTIHHIIDDDPGTLSGFIPMLLNKEQSYAINNSAGHGMLIQHVIPGTLANKLGLKGGNLSVVIGRSPILLGGDILLEVGGRAITNLASAVQIKKHFASFEKGDRVTFKFLRNGEKKEMYGIVE